MLYKNLSEHINNNRYHQKVILNSDDFLKTYNLPNKQVTNITNDKHLFEAVPWKYKSFKTNNLINIFFCIHMLSIKLFNIILTNSSSRRYRLHMYGFLWSCKHLLNKLLYYNNYYIIRHTGNIMLLCEFIKIKKKKLIFWNNSTNVMATLLTHCILFDIMKV